MLDGCRRGNSWSPVHAARSGGLTSSMGSSALAAREAISCVEGRPQAQRLTSSRSLRGCSTLARHWGPLRRGLQCGRHARALVRHRAELVGERCDVPHIARSQQGAPLCMHAACSSPVLLSDARFRHAVWASC